MKYWEALMRDVRHAYNHKSYAIAIELNKQALKHAMALFEQDAEDDIGRVMAAIMVSHFNLSDSYIALGQLLQAQHILKKALNFLEEVVNAPDTCNEKKAAGFRAYNHTYTEWIKFHKLYGQQLSDDQPTAIMAQSNNYIGFNTSKAIN